MDWAKHAAESILPRSRERQDLRRALQEWHYTGNVNDLDAPVETCQLCGHPEIRYQFEIWNRLTAHALLIGSECIKRFDISAVDDEGNRLDRDATRAKVDRDRRKLVEDARERRMMRSLIRLARVEEKFPIESFISYYRDKRGAFTPKQLLLLFDRMDEHKVTHHKGDFKMVIRRNREKQQLAEFHDHEVERLWGCMTSVQREWYDERFPGRRAEHAQRRQHVAELMAKIMAKTDAQKRQA